MKKFSVYLCFLLFLTLVAGTLTSCGRKSGCAGVYDSTKVKVGKDGKPKGKATSGLFDKKTRRKMNR